MSAGTLIRLVGWMVCVSLILGSQCNTSLSPDGDDNDNTTTTGAQAWFDQVWSDFDEHYSYFIEKDIDWDALRTQHRPDFAQEMTPAEFAQAFSVVLNELHDWHVWIQAPGEDPIGYDGTYPVNYPPAPLTRYAQGGTYTSIGDDVIQHAWVGDNVAYIAVNTLDTGKWAAVTDDAIGNMFTTYQNADGMIIDIRRNNGGNEDNAARIASRLTDAAVEYGSVMTRNGPNHDDFDPLVTKTLDPSDRLHYEGTVVALIGQRCLSSAEWFTCMLEAAGAHLMGDHTRGGSGNPTVLTLDNGVSYSISTWVAYDLFGQVIEDHGIEPLDYTSPEDSYDDTHDFLLESAIGFLEGP